MANLLQTGSAFLERKRHLYSSSPVVYRRGNASVTLNATVGKTAYDTDDGAGITIRSESRDYLIRTADLILSGSVTLPALGDKIQETVSGKTYTYEVMALGVESHYRYSDPYRETLRVHTRHVATEAV